MNAATAIEKNDDARASVASAAASRGELLFVIGSLNTGGAEMHLARVLPRLRAAGYAPAVFTLAAAGALAERVRGDGVPVLTPWISGGPRFLLWRVCVIALAATKLLTHLVWRRPKLVHFFLPQSYLIGAPVALLAKALRLGPRKLAMSRRSLNRYRNGAPAAARWLEPRLHRRMSAVLGNSREVARELIADEGAPRDRTYLIYNGVEAAPAPLSPEMRAERRRALDLDPGDIVLTKVANLIPYKGHADLIDACGRLDRAQPWRLLLVGDDRAGLVAKLSAQAEALGIGERIRFLGAREDVAQIYALSDVGVLASHEEGFSNAVVEGMAAGLPMVVTDVGGNAEAVLDGVCGLVAPSRDPQALATVLGRIVAEPDLRARLGEAARRRAEAEFRLEICVANYLRLYAALLDPAAAEPLDGLRAADHGL